MAELASPARLRAIYATATPVHRHSTTRRAQASFKRPQEKQALARWSLAGLAALQLSLVPAEPSFAAGTGASVAAAPAEAASTSGVASAMMPFAAGGSWSLEFLADASGVMSLLLGDADTQVTGRQAASLLIGSTEEASSRVAAPVKRRTALDPAGRPCYSRLLCGSVYVAAAPSLSQE